MRPILTWISLLSIVATVILLGSTGFHRMEAPASESTRVELKAGDPDLFAEYESSIRTAEWEDRPSYPQNYLMDALGRARKAAKTSAPLPWVERGPANVGGRTRRIVVDPDDANRDTWFAAAVSGGIWKTTDAGLSWTHLTPDLPNLAFSSLVQAFSNPNRMYAGTGEGYFNGDAGSGAGIFRSDNRGATWTQLSVTSEDINFRYVNRMVLSPSDPDLVVAATRTGIFRSTDAGNSWNQVYQAAFSPGVLQVIADPTDFNRQYATESGVGILGSTDAGRTWSLMSEGLDNLSDGAFGSRIEMAIAPSDPSILYALVESASGSERIFTSSNFGALWAQVSAAEGTSDPDIAGSGNQGWYDLSIAVNPFDPLAIFVGGVGLYRADMSGSVTRGILSSREESGTDSFLTFVNFGGSHFGGTLRWGLSEDEAIVDSSDFVSVEVRFGVGRSQKAHRFTPADGPGIAFSTYPYSNYVDVPFEVWDVTNNRQLMVSFRDRLNDGQFNLIPRNDQNLGREYIIISAIDYDASTPDPSIAQDGGLVNKMLYFFWPMLVDGQTWDPASLPTSELKINYRIVTAPERATVAIGSGDVHVDQHTVVPIVTDAATQKFELVAGNDGGVYHSKDGGKSWISRNNGYNTAQFYGVDKKPTFVVLFGGTQDNGTWRSFGNPNASQGWISAFGGDGFEVAWNQANNRMMMGASQFNGFTRSVDGGINWSDATSGMTDTGSGKGQFITTLDRGVQNPDLVFTIGSAGVWKSTDFGGTWSLRAISEADWGFRSSGKVRISLANENVVWAGYEMDPTENPPDATGKMHVSTDRGETFTAVPTPVDLSPGRISGLATHPDDDQVAFALFSAFRAPKILRTKDLGQTWEDLSGFFRAPAKASSNGFPDVAVHDLLVLPGRTSEIWVGTSIGIFISTDDGGTWQFADNGLPAVSVWQMRIVDDKILVATHGRGVWSVPLDAAVPTATEEEGELPAEVSLAQNYPNPFNPSTTIRFSLPGAENVELSVFDVAGRRVATLVRSTMTAGVHEVQWDASGLASGMYLYRLSAGAASRTKTMMLLK
jgi:photosystem II stability/assembly factor-like uncharacterized protein